MSKSLRVVLALTGVFFGLLVGLATEIILWLLFVHSPTDFGITLALVLALSFAVVGAILGLVITNKIRSSIEVKKHRNETAYLPEAVGKDVWPPPPSL